MEAGSEFQFLEVMGTNVLANEVVRHISNLTEKDVGDWRNACYTQSMLIRAPTMIGFIKKGKRRDMRQRVEGVGKGRIVNQPDGPFLNCIQGGKRIFRGSSPQIKAVFRTGTDLGLVEGEKMQGREKSLEPEYEANLPCCRFRHRGNVFIPRQIRCDRDAQHGQTVTHFQGIRTEENIRKILKHF